MKAVRIRTSPSLALVKYWGKLTRGRNLPATPSIAVTLGGLDTATVIHTRSHDQPDEVRLAGQVQEPARFEPFFTELRRRLHTDLHFLAYSDNSFPSSAGLASSSSGFAALGLGCTCLVSNHGCDTPVMPDQVLTALASELARIGSASAARAVYGGFTHLPAGAKRAERLYGPEHWPALRILVAVTSTAPKADSSRSAMERTRLSSPYYGPWIHDAKVVCAEALIALDRQDLQRLGELARLSYLRMHASAMAAEPPVLYWLPASLGVIQACATLRTKGVRAWETMDAGPQVKVLCLDQELGRVRQELADAVPGLSFIEAKPGIDPDLGEWHPQREPDA
ncbi:MAG: diphosphomevalonate decarboxylase [Spirochaetes bacterium RIFOXYC1_FULL_54_7]|nr:MAG: diphosphomevalonate decarboxylase [Spirochaetes bacterium RIFOXYC1_FULL_54_7]